APLLKGEQIVPLGQTGEKRDERFPDVPTFLESGVQDFDVSYWFALLVPADTPKAATAKWKEALSAVLADAEVQEKFAAAGLSNYDVEPHKAQSVLLEEVHRWEEVVKTAGMSAN